MTNYRKDKSLSICICVCVGNRETRNDKMNDDKRKEKHKTEMKELKQDVAEQEEQK